MIPNTVAADYTQGDRAAARARLGLADEDCVLLSVGRRDEREQYKGHDRVIGELAGLRAQSRRKVSYLIAGDGRDAARLKAIAKARGVADRTRFLGHVDRGALTDLYRAADLFVLPSHGEGFGIVFLEAMAYETPALGLAVGGATDALGDGDLGCCVALEEFPGAFARAVVAKRPDPQDLSARVAARFGQDVFRVMVAQSFARLYRQNE